MSFEYKLNGNFVSVDGKYSLTDNTNQWDIESGITGIEFIHNDDTQMILSNDGGVTSSDYSDTFTTHYSVLNGSLFIGGTILTNGLRRHVEIIDNANYTLGFHDDLMIFKNHSGVTCILPSIQSGTDCGCLGRQYEIINDDNSAMTVVASGTDVIAGSGTYNLIANRMIKIFNDDIGHWYLQLSKFDGS